MSNVTFTGKKIKNTYDRVVQISGSRFYDGLGNEIKEAFERDSDGNLQPTDGPFHDTFWEADENGYKQPRDIKWWLDEDYNLIMIPRDNQ